MASSSKAPLTDSTHVRLLAGVQFFMAKQVGSTSEFLLTGATQVGLLARVHFFMPNQAASVTKALLTSATHVGFFSSVHIHVAVPVPFSTENFLANRAAVVHLLTSTHFPITGRMAVLLTARAGMKLPSRLDRPAVVRGTPCVSRVYVAGAGVTTSLRRNVSTIS